MKRALAGLSVVVAMCLAWPGWSAAQESRRDTGPQLRVVTADGRTTFRIGERIPLELVFTGPGDGRYAVTTGSTERPTPLEEKLDISPEDGWVDPLKIYFSGGMAGSWVSGEAKLSGKPVIVPMELNEWVRFDQPGQYQIVVTSRRVEDLASNGPLSALTGKGLMLRSNPIEITIIPASAAWQKAKLAEIEALLAAPVKEYAPPPPERSAAIADLRALGTADAAAVMAKHLRYGDPLSYQCALGLAGLREDLHPAALADLQTEMDDPDFPVSSGFLNAMAVLQMSDGPERQMQTEHLQFMDQAWQAAFESMESKEGKARTATAETLLNFGHRSETPRQSAEIGRVLAAGLMELPAPDQAETLEYRWDLIRSNITLSELQKLAATPLKNPESNASDDYTARELKSAALHRLYELDPAGAQQEVLREIGTPNPALTAQALAFLPKQKLPQFEYMWAQQFATTKDYGQEALLAGLLAKFGEGDAVGLVESKASARVGDWECAPQAAALGYLIEFDSAEAELLVERALAARGKTGCFHSLFQDVAAYAAGPVLTKAAIQAMNDPDAQVAINALNYLTWYGDASARNAIWNRYAAWSRQWRGRSDEMAALKPGGFPYQMLHPYAIGLGDALVQALMGNQGWIATPDLIAKVLAGCIGEQVCRTAKQMAQEVGPGPYSLMVFPQPDSGTTFSISQYQIKSIALLEEKVAQFPKGTRFVLPDIGDPKLEEELRVVFAKHGMILTHARGGMIG